jgi:hypothetical protein
MLSGPLKKGTGTFSGIGFLGFLKPEKVPVPIVFGTQFAPAKYVCTVLRLPWQYGMMTAWLPRIYFPKREFRRKTFAA